MKHYKTLDLFKFIAAFLIIILHTSPFGSYSKILTFGLRNIVTVIAVPFFFACSGFITFSKLNAMNDSKEKDKYIIHYLKRVLLMYLIWSIIYFPFVLYNWIQKGEFTYWNVLLYFRDFIFEGSYKTIWFLPALLSATVLVYLLNKKVSLKNVFLISIPFYLIALMGSSYWGLASKLPIIESFFTGYYYVLDTIKNGVLFGFVFVSLGAYISKIQYKLNIKVSTNVIWIIFSSLLIIVEASLLSYFDINLRGCDTLLSLIPFTFSILLIGINIEINIKNDICIKLRKISLLMFLCQRIPLSLIDLFMSNSIIHTNSMIYFCTVLVLTLILSLTIIELSKKIKWFNYLY